MYVCTGSGNISQGEELLAAAITGGFTSFVTTPLDLVKTKLMIQVPEVAKYIIHVCVIHTYT